MRAGRPPTGVSDVSARNYLGRRGRGDVESGPRGFGLVRAWERGVFRKELSGE